jgi:hypothetical protein
MRLLNPDRFCRFPLLSGVLVGTREGGEALGLYSFSLV